MSNELPEDFKDKVILAGVCGSQAYGLATPTSDEDIIGIYLEPTRKFVGISAFVPKEKKLTKVHKDPDWAYHEVGKFMNMALKCNPTITELLWLDGYRTLTPMGKMLIDNRLKFLSTPYVKYAYSRYCFSQAHKLNMRGGTYGNGRNKRYEKHTRHLFRLLMQGRELLETGKLTVKVTPEVREELFATASLTPNQIVDYFAKEIVEFENINSVLPEKADIKSVNELLLKIRKSNW